MKNENREYCKRIALELEAYANGHVYRDENGETVYSKEDRDDLEQLCVGDYMASEVLDFDITIGGDWEYSHLAPAFERYVQGGCATIKPHVPTM